MSNQSTPPGPAAGLPCLELPFFEWGGDKYPVIADLPQGFKLVAHKNAPAITNGDLFSTLDEHDDDEEWLTEIKRAAWTKYEEWTWNLLRPRLACPTYGKEAPVPDSAQQLRSEACPLPVVDTLNKLPEVTWDRFAGDGIEHVSVFGWIGRDDGRSDFAFVMIDKDGPWLVSTSSAKHSAEFSARLGMASDGHTGCRRVEDHFPGVRCVRLNEKRKSADSLLELQVDVHAWSQETFPHQTPASKYAHLRREIEELGADLTDGGEMADCLLLLAGLAEMNGIDLLAQGRRKLEINRARSWGQPDSEGVSSHVPG